MIDKYEQFMEEIDFWPVGVQSWNMFELNHLPPANEEERLDREKYIVSKVEGKGGLYIYKSLDDRTLYVGKAKLLKNRLVSHYRESFMQVPGDTKDQKWHRFFVKNQGKLMVYWKQLDGEENRRILEMMLEYLLVPEFKHWK